MVEWTPTLIFIAILLSVPVQFYLSPQSASDSKYYLYRLIEEVRELYGRYVPQTAVEYSGETSSEETDVSDLVDVDEILDEGALKDSRIKGTELFGGSEEPRDPRAPHIRFRVGQVVRHKIHKYKGVIIAWDPSAKAPEWWLKRAHKGRKELADLPNYTVLIDTRDRLIPQVGYVAEENIVLEDDGAVVHPLVKHYFEAFDGKCYQSRPWHRKIYPND